LNTDHASPNHEVDDNLDMTLPEGTDASAIFARLNKAINGINQPNYEDLQSTQLKRSSMSPIANMTTEAFWNGIPNGFPNHHTGGLPNDYQEANGYSTEAACRDGRREVDQDSLKHWRYWNHPPPEDFNWGRRVRGRC